jgi:glycine C-acetyltransferase
MSHAARPVNGEPRAVVSYRDYDLSHFYYGEGERVADLFRPHAEWWAEARDGSYALYQVPLASAPDTTVRVRTPRPQDAPELLNLSSYNYLGMSTSPVVKAAAMAAIERYGLGASGGPILSGMFDVHRDLEAEIARFKKKESCTLFPTGYAANIGILSAIARPGDQLFLDQYAHASLVDGAILSRARTTFFRHNNERDLERKLAAADSASGASGRGRKLVVIEGVYSMDGDFCRLPEIVAVCQRHGASILLDEAHSAFIWGANGRGVAEEFGLEDAVEFHMGTLSKALGGIGGYACGSREFVDYLEAYARSRFFSCTLPPAVSAGVLASLRHVDAHPELRNSLKENVAFTQALFRERGIDIGASTSQVIPVMIYDDAKAFPVGERIRAQGVMLQPVIYPGVGKMKARLRVSLTASHTREQLTRAAEIIAAALHAEGIL